MNWQDYKEEFEFDGSWLDIYVLNTSSEDWQRLMDFFASSVYTTSFTIDGIEAPLPQNVAEILANRDEANTSLSIYDGQIRINCHFFWEEEIEFDIDPREIQNEAQAQQIFAFMRQVSLVLNKEVILTPENAENIVIFKSLPNSEKIQYRPNGTNRPSREEDSAFAPRNKS